MGAEDQLSNLGYKSHLHPICTIALVLYGVSAILCCHLHIIIISVHYTVMCDEDYVMDT